MTPAAPNLEERFCAAAFAILTDSYDHSRDAQRWAVRTLRRANGGGTAFQRHLRRGSALQPKAVNPQEARA